MFGKVGKDQVGSFYAPPCILCSRSVPAAQRIWQQPAQTLPKLAQLPRLCVSRLCTITYFLHNPFEHVRVRIDQNCSNLSTQVWDRYYITAVFERVYFNLFSFFHNPLEQVRVRIGQNWSKLNAHVHAGFTEVESQSKIQRAEHTKNMAIGLK